MENETTPKQKVKKGLILIGAAVLIFVVISLVQKQKNFEILKSEISGIFYSEQNQTSGGFIRVTPIKTLNENLFTSLAIDENNNQSFEEEEWKIKNFPTTFKENVNSGLAFKTTSQLSRQRKVKIIVSLKKLNDTSFDTSNKEAQVLTQNITLTEEKLDEIYGTENTDNPNESMKQGTGNTATNVEIPKITDNSTPDFRQRSAECAPTSAANGLVSLAWKNGAADKLPETSLKLIDELKTEMNWTYKNGVLPDDFVAGKNRWAVTHGLPITTEKIGDGDGRGTLQEIRDALTQGAAAEMRIRFADANLKVVGGHLISIVAVHTIDGKDYIDVNDPASPSGTERYEVSANEILNYPFKQGHTVIGWGFSQKWTSAPMGGNLEPMTEAEIKAIRDFAGEKQKIKALKYQDKFLPLSEVHVGKGDHCDSKEESFPHWHSNNGTHAVVTDGTKVYDNQGCGYGKVDAVEVVDVEI